MPLVLTSQIGHAINAAIYGSDFFLIRDKKGNTPLIFDYLIFPTLVT